MKTNLLKLSTLAMLPAALMIFTSCSTPDADDKITITETSKSMEMVDTTTTTNTVTAIDATARKVTLTGTDGKSTVIKCGPEVANFAQIEIGDQVKAVMTEELAIYLGKGNPPAAAAAATVRLAPLGAKPGGVIAATVVITAKITAIDAKTRKVTLALPNGSTKIVKARPQIDLGAVNVGDDVTLQYTESTAITVEKP